MRLTGGPMALALVMAALVAGGSAMANDCPRGLICASASQTVVKALQSAGYDTGLGTADSTGDPLVTAAGQGTEFVVLFMDCTEHAKCESLEFSVVTESSAARTVAAKVNNNTRFVTAGVAGNDVLVSMDVTTVGGLNRANFASVLDYWKSALTRAQGLIAGGKP